MIAARDNMPAGVRRFRGKLLLAMMLVVLALTTIALVVAQRNVAEAVERELQREFQGELAALHNVQALRHAVLAERCRSLVRKPRIHAALEDDALDLLYPSARDELRDVMAAGREAGGYALRAEFYRFLDRRGGVIAPAQQPDVGWLLPEEEAQLALPRVPERQQLGYLARKNEAGEEVMSELIAMPIVSGETGEAIAALVLGFKPATFTASRAAAGIDRGVWLEGKLRLNGLGAEEEAVLSDEVARAVARNGEESVSFERDVEGVPHLVFCKKLNPESWYAPAYEVCVYSLAGMLERQRELRWRVLGAGGVLLLAGFGASHAVAKRLARPVEKLAADSEENLNQRVRVEAALEMTHEELQRAARFSADASHQLKTPVTVLRAGLEELLAREHWTPEECREISALIHQTYRLSGVIEDLLLLSRMDAGRLTIEFRAVNLTELIDAAMDDLGVQTDELGLKVEVDRPAALWVSGEKRYLSLILQNLLENARKYNRRGGGVRVTARAEEEMVRLDVANTGPAIPAEARGHIFERFHRGGVGENVPGYGLGLNLARELARLHGGELELARSDGEWTEFRVSFRKARGVLREV